MLPTVLQSAVTMPTKNFFPSSLAPTHSSHYPFLYTACKCPLSGPSTSTLLNCQAQDSHPGPSSGTTLNCNLAQTSHDMPSGHVRHLGHLGHLRHLRHLRHLGHLGHWMYCGMPSGPYVILGHLGQLRHPSHLGHLSHLSNIGDLDPLNPSPLDPALTDSQLEAFITEPDPMDPGLLEGYYEDDSLDPISTDTPLLLPCLDRHYISQITLNEQPRTFS